MLKVYFGEWKSGRLKRLPYLGYYLLTIFLVMAIMFGGMFAMGLMDAVMGGDMEVIEKAVEEGGGIVFVLSFVVVIFGAAVAQFNIFAKRVRDMGLSVLWTMVGLFIFAVALSIAFPPQEIMMESSTVETVNATVRTASLSTHSSNSPANILNLLVFLALIFIPSDMFKKRSE